MNISDISWVIEQVRAKSPLVHCITNYVTVNDVANIVLACGASPIMADDIAEAADITSICTATDINIGTLNARTVESMLAAGRKAAELHHPVILDPVGAGASKLRTDTVFHLMKDIPFTVIRGNISEIKTIAKGSGTTKGVDADAADRVTEDNLGRSVSFIKSLARNTGSVIAVTGAIDIIADTETAYVCRNGRPMMGLITGSGCMLSAVVAAFCGAVPAEPVKAAAAAVSAMGLCGEHAYTKVQAEGEGTGSFRTRLIDSMSLLDGKQFAGGSRLEQM